MSFLANSLGKNKIRQDRSTSTKIYRQRSIMLKIQLSRRKSIGKGWSRQKFVGKDYKFSKKNKICRERVIRTKFVKTLPDKNLLRNNKICRDPRKIFADKIFTSINQLGDFYNSITTKYTFCREKYLSRDVLLRNTSFFFVMLIHIQKLFVMLIHIQKKNSINLLGSPSVASPSFCR